MPFDLERLAREHLAPLAGRRSGLATFMLRRGEAWTGAFGPVAPGAVFELGSLTKALVGTLLAELCRSGVVRLSDEVSAYLPPTAAPRAPITLEALATHTSGLPRLPLNLWPHLYLFSRDPYARYGEAALHRAVRRSRPVPGAYAYSNFGFGLLGHVLARAAGQPFAALLAERVLLPLGMAESSAEPGPALVARHASGLGLLGLPTSCWHFQALAGVGAVHAPLADAAQLLRAALEPASTPLGAALEEAMRPHRPLPGGGHVGLGWHLRPSRGRLQAWHNGGTGGFGAMLAVDRAAGAGVVALQNRAHSAALDRAALALLEALG